MNQLFSGLIWKLKTDTSRPLIAIESRHTETKEVAFSVLNYATGEVNFLERRYEADSGISLWHLAPSGMVLNLFDEARFGEPKGFLLADPLSGEIVIERYNAGIDIANNSGLRLFDFKIQPRRYYWMDYTGQNIVEPVDEMLDDQITFPISMTENDLPNLIHHTEVVGPVSGLRHNSTGIYSFHEANENNLNQRIIVIQNDRIALDEIMNSSIQKLQPEAFFIQQNHLLFIRNKQEIVSYLIN